MVAHEPLSTVPGVMPAKDRQRLATAVGAPLDATQTQWPFGNITDEPSHPDFPPEPARPLNREWVREAEASLQRERASSSPAPFDVAQMRKLIEYSHHELRAQLYELFKEPVFHHHYGETLQQERARTMMRWKRITDLGIFENTIALRSPEGRAKYEAVMESVGMLDYSLDIKLGVHYGLFGATIALMGSDDQVARWLPKVESCDMLGCFALTELGHGSNARGIGTRADYDPAAETFIIHTPNEEAQKYWIGGAYRSARWTAAFAQLYIDGECKGIHPFVVRIRNDDGSPVPGVTVDDCGHKCGLNGVDNGRIWFEHVRVPREQLLCRVSQVSKNGVYTSLYKSADERFGRSLASLTGGRISIASGGLNQAKIALTIAIRYASQRRAFGPPGGEEVCLMDYQSHQVRLLAPLATTYVMQFVLNELKKKWHAQRLGRELHEWSSGFKALMTWHMADTLQEAREACGGQGYKSENRIGPNKAEHDIALTFEGDNRILLQAVAKSVLPQFVRGVRANGHFKGHFAYLNQRKALQHANVDAMDVRSALFAQTVMRRREAAIFLRLARELEAKQKSGVPAFDAWNDSAALVESAARAHTELLITETFNSVLDDLRQSGHTEIAEILSLCGALYVARRIDLQPDFLRLRVLSPLVADRVHEAVLDIAKELRPHALHLVNAFGIPPHLLAPIAFDYAAHNSRARL